MKKFEFRLQRALEVRRMQALVEKEKLQRLAAAQATLLDRLTTVHRERDASFDLPLEQQRSGCEYREFLASAGRKLQGDIEQLTVQILEQRKALAEAERRCELLDRLRRRRLQEWNAALTLELDELAADAHRARLHAARCRVEKR